MTQAALAPARGAVALFSAFTCFSCFGYADALGIQQRRPRVAVFSVTVVCGFAWLLVIGTFAATLMFPYFAVLFPIPACAAWFSRWFIGVDAALGYALGVAFPAAVAALAFRAPWGSGGWQWTVIAATATTVTAAMLVELGLRVYRTRR